MSKLLFTKDHEWLKIEGDTAYVGVTDYAQSELGDIIFVELPSENETFNSNDVFGTIEAVKTVADLFMPVSSEIIQINSKIEDSPEVINEDAEGDGWIVKVKITNMDDVDNLLSYEMYQEIIK
tara:strand:+ start:1115 stop:1483 length:369 start_codon:yes stop_codon:yes gene_type:complete